ncbi:MAG: hypothetical protein K0S81_217 [Rhodospirillales bacterium]|nr:hypothetical protein [Rhodospirillales bacterium]
MSSSAKFRLVETAAELRPETPADLTHAVEDPSRPARGILIACGLSLLIWLAIAGILL